MALLKSAHFIAQTFTALMRFSAVGFCGRPCSETHRLRRNSSTILKRSRRHPRLRKRAIKNSNAATTGATPRSASGGRGSPRPCSRSTRRGSRFYRPHEGTPIADTEIDALGNLGSDTYHFDQAHESIGYRENAAGSVMALLAISALDPEALGKQATRLVSARFTDPYATRKLPIWRKLLLRQSASGALIEHAREALDRLSDELIGLI